MDSKKTYRKANGRRVEGQGLAIRVAMEVKGLMLAHAYVLTKSAGMQLNVSKLDGLPRNCIGSDNKDTVNVEVVDGFVRKSWVS